MSGRYSTPSAFKQAVEQRLRDKAAGDGGIAIPRPSARTEFWVVGSGHMDLATRQSQGMRPGQRPAQRFAWQRCARF